MEYKDTVETIKQFYLDKLNNEIYHIDNFIQTGNTIKKELLNDYESLMIKENIVDVQLKASPCHAIIEEYEQIRKIQEEIKAEYIQSLIENILHKEIKKELENTVRNIESIDISSAINFINNLIDTIIQEDIASNDIKSKIKNAISNEEDEAILAEVLKYYKYLKKSRSSK